MGRRTTWALLVATLLAMPWVSANPDQCDVQGGEVASAPGIEVKQTQQSCSGSLGTQTFNRYDAWINETGPVGRHNLTYKSETDTGLWEPSWCRYAPGSASCTETTLAFDGNNMSARYRQNGDGSWCEYSFVVRRSTGGGAGTTAPEHEQCDDYLTTLP